MNLMIQKKVSVLLFALLLAGVVSASTAYDSDSSYVTLLLEEVTPEPVEPGQDVTVKIRIINEGGAMAEDVSVKLNSDGPFYLKTTSDDQETSNDLCVGCSMDNTYYLTVDADAKSGLYPLTFDISQDGTIIRPSDAITIKIVGKPDVILYAEELADSVTSGDTFELGLELKNIGTGIARNIKIIPLSEDVLMLGSNIHLVGELFPGKDASVTSGFTIKSALIPDTYKLPMKITYSDEQGNAYEDTFDVGIKVSEKADIGIQSIKITPAYPMLGDGIHLEGIVENTGTGGAEKVTIELQTEKDSYKTFVGQLQADDDAPFYFDMKPETIGKQEATLRISYADDFGAHSFETALEIEVGKPTNKALAVLVIVGIAIAIGAYVMYKRKK